MVNLYNKYGCFTTNLTTNLCWDPQDSSGCRTPTAKTEESLVDSKETTMYRNYDTEQILGRYRANFFLIRGAPFLFYLKSVARSRAASEAGAHTANKCPCPQEPYLFTGSLCPPGCQIRKIKGTVPYPICQHLR